MKQSIFAIVGVIGSCTAKLLGGGIWHYRPCLIFMATDYITGLNRCGSI